jgi:anti-sigma factor RsiW
MTCREFIDFIIDYLEQDLSVRERMEFEEHLAKCPDCTTYLKSYAETITLGNAAFAAPEAPVPADVPEALVQAILASRQRNT